MQSLQDHFLIAMPAMADPNFNETVTYICKHDAEGAFGIVINRPSDLSLGEMLGQLAIDLTDRSLAERPVMHGGPVEPERGFVLHRSDRAFEATLAAGADIKLTSSPDILAAIGPRHGPGSGRSSRSATRAGVAASSRSSSAATPGSTVPANPAIIFETPFEQRWTAALGLPGVDIRRITQYAGHA